MKDFDNLKDLWKTQADVKLPDVSEILKKVKREKLTYTNKILFQVAILIATIFALIWIGSLIDFKMMTTYIGLGIMLLCVAGFSAIRLYQMITLKKIDLTEKPSVTLNKLENYYNFQQLVGAKITPAYFILLNMAFVFYFIEVMQPMSTSLKTICLTVYIAWMSFAYFYLGKKQKKKENDRINSIIDSIKEMESNYEK
ncbi:hypothetical protein NAT51_11700 [Flavobacterium amniphilum]|uniref:hypothetical protein n=1 Tax=Flavobacterium amniphilum TaxID=1834035 RepID=UPI00202A8D59|nr:hypothetical protein [Flavobacterium amniphilum]MCL9806190.1 hypothetical protein [Flavobacterium amniphilum]